MDDGAGLHALPLAGVLCFRSSFFAALSCCLLPVFPVESLLLEAGFLVTACCFFQSAQLQSSFCTCPAICLVFWLENMPGSLLQGSFPRLELLFTFSCCCKTAPEL